MRDGQARKEIARVRARVAEVSAEVFRRETDLDLITRYATRDDLERLEVKLDAIIKHLGLKFEYPKVVVKEV